MEFSNLTKNKLTYLPISTPYYYLNYLFSHSSQSNSSSYNLKTLVSPRSSPIPISNRTRFHPKPISHPSYSFISPTGSSTFCYITLPSSRSSQPLRFDPRSGYTSQRLKLELLRPHMVTCVRSFKVGNKGIDRLTQYATPKQISEIIQLVSSGDSEMESKLASMNVSLSIASVIEIFCVLNCEKLSALRFFEWIRQFGPDFYLNSDICSLVVDNCGRLDDYETMQRLLNEFSVNQICLTKKAFGFLPVMISTKALTKKSIGRVIEVLNEVRGSCHVSGIRALIEMFSVLGSFEMAKYVIEKTEKKVSYYSILVRELCRRCEFKGARDVLDEMRQAGCEPSTQTYNYILGSLCKNGNDTEACEVFEEMLGRDCQPDAVTYEIFIYNSCRFGKFDVAFRFFDHMVARGLEPRSLTHAAFIKSYFNRQHYEEAYKYVVASADKYKSSSNNMYSLLASLHNNNGNPVLAKNILLEMIKKGLRPNFSVYRRVLKHLQTSGQEDMARYLASMFSSLGVQSG